MTASVSSTIRQAGLVVAFAVSFSALSSSSSFAFSAEAQQMCTGDAFRLCGEEIPDVDRVKACMIRKQTQLSPDCRVYFHPDPPTAAARPLSIRAHARKWRRHKRSA